MKEPTKKLLNLTKRRNKVCKDYTEAMRAYVNSAEPMGEDRFWDWIEHLAKEIRTQREYNDRDPIKSAIHNTLIEMRRHNDRHYINELGKWVATAQFLKSYRICKSDLNEYCWEMPGVEKGDDAYGDWLDALPLAGRKICKGIMGDDLANYKQVYNAVEAHTSLYKLIMEGENYITGKLEDKVVQTFAHCVDMMGGMI